MFTSVWHLFSTFKGKAFMRTVSKFARHPYRKEELVVKMDRLLSEKLSCCSIKFFLRASLSKPGLNCILLIIILQPE